MARALDHIVWPTRDLDPLAATFARLGFTVGRRNRHPWGTVNHIIQFDGAFLELLGFADDYRPLPAEDSAVPFAGFCERFLKGSESGAAMLVLRSQDAVADARALEREGLGHGRLLPFRRNAEGPDGSDRTVAFTIAFAHLPGLPNLGTFLCEQHRPENFWNAAMQRHANGVSGIARLEVRGTDVTNDLNTLRRFAEDTTAGSFDSVRLSAECRIAIGVADPGSAPMSSVGFRVNDLSATSTLLTDAGFHAQDSKRELRITLPELGGTSLSFRS